ncbi:MAG: diguanylate cyclase [Fibrobacter sp.]|nr:diguanylate cyclase [Fibrobacter sp.]
MPKDYLKEFELSANRFTLKAIGFTAILFGLVWILNMLGIFIVDDSIMNTGFFGCIIINVITFAVCRAMGLGNSRTKYVAIFFATLSVEFVGVMLTYHALLITALPILLSVQYRNKKVILFSYVMTALGHVVNVYGGYYFGLCNANMLLFTANSTEYYLQQIVAGTLAPNDPGMPVNLSLFVFFVVPQWFILLAFLPVLFHISTQIESRVQREMFFSQKNDVDFMTGMLSKICFERLSKEYYHTLESIAILLWDINDLKQINDTLGQSVGDTVVAMTAGSIKPLQNSSQKAFRIGGDRFILIIENANHGDINKVLLKWNSNVDQLNSNSTTKISAAVGYSQGRGDDLEFLIKDASHMMHNHKSTTKMHAI